ncbi:EamA family transporter, partial [Streptomyces violaceoruber]
MAPVTAVWGALMFGEPFGVQTALGLAVGLAAVVVVRRGGGARRERPVRSGADRPAAGGPTADQPTNRPTDRPTAAGSTDRPTADRR